MLQAYSAGSLFKFNSYLGREILFKPQEGNCKGNRLLGGKQSMLNWHYQFQQGMFRHIGAYISHSR
jgi:hypothetical protein